MNYYEHRKHRQGVACGQGSLPAASSIEAAIALLTIHHPGMKSFGLVPMSKIFQIVCLLNNVPFKKIYINIKLLWDNLSVHCEDVTLPRHLLVGLIKS